MRHNLNYVIHNSLIFQLSMCKKKSNLDEKPYLQAMRKVKYPQI